MFLNMLNQKEKENFLELVYFAISHDSVPNESELSMYQTYLHETNLMSYELKNKSLDVLIREFNSSTRQSKKIIIIELLGILLSDDNYENSEKLFLKKVTTEWNFRETEVKKMLHWVEDFNGLLKEGYEFITRKER